MHESLNLCTKGNNRFLKGGGRSRLEGVKACPQKMFLKIQGF